MSLWSVATAIFRSSRQLSTLIKKTVHTVAGKLLLGIWLVGLSMTATAQDAIIDVKKYIDINGDWVTFTIIVTNNGAGPANGTRVSDILPFGLVNVTWKCYEFNGAKCGSNEGTDYIDDIISELPAGGQTRYEIQALVASRMAEIFNEVKVWPPTDGVCQGTNKSIPCTAVAGYSRGPVSFDISKTATTRTAWPGATVVYTVTVDAGYFIDNINAGAGLRFYDPGAPGLINMKWTCDGGCPSPSGDGPIDQLHGFGNQIATYTITGTVSNPLDPSITSIDNRAYLYPTMGTGVLYSPGATEAFATVPVVQSPPNVSVTKTADTQLILPGGSVVYTLTVSNSNQIALENVLISDAVPAGITDMSWTCTAVNGFCPKDSGSGSLNQTVQFMWPDSTLTYVLTAKVSGTPPATVTNTATVTPPAGSLCLPDNTVGPCTASVSTPTAVPQISVTKVANVSTLTAGGKVVYTLTVRSTGQAPTHGTVVTDAVPAGITAMTWTCTGADGGVCPHASGSGALNETIATMPAGSSVTYTLEGTLSLTPTATVTNTASVTPPVGAVCASGDPAGPCTASASLSATPLAPTPVPTLSQWALMLLSLLLVGAGAEVTRRRH